MTLGSIFEMMVRMKGIFSPPEQSKQPQVIRFGILSTAAVRHNQLSREP